MAENRNFSFSWKIQTISFRLEKKNQISSPTWANAWVLWNLPQKKLILERCAHFQIDPRRYHMPRQKSTLGGILNFSGNRPKVADNGPKAGKLGSGSNLRMLRIPKSVGLGTFRALYGGLRAQNRKLANQRDPVLGSLPILGNFFASKQPKRPFRVRKSIFPIFF